MAEAAPSHGAKIVFLSSRERGGRAAARDGARLVRRARRLDGDAVLVDSIVAAAAAPWLAVRPPPLPVIAVVHQSPGGTEHGVLGTRAQAALDRHAYRRARLVVATSDLLAGALMASGVPPERVRVVPPGRDVPAAQLARAPDLRHGRRAAFLCVANWLPHKGITELLDAFAALPASAGTLHLVGDEHADGCYAREVRRRLAAPALADRVVRHGPLPRDALAPLYAAADVFVLPADREVYGMAWAEAMAFGVPVVGWRAGNHPHLATDGREGLLAAPGDVRALREALGSLAADEGLRRRLGQAAAARARSRPTWEESATAFFAAIRSVVAAAADADAAPHRRQRSSAGEHT